MASQGFSREGVRRRVTPPPIEGLGCTSTEGGLITGAGGGGFALLVAKEGQADALCEGLNKLRKDAAFAKSSVASYRLNSQGILLSE